MSTKRFHFALRVCAAVAMMAAAMAFAHQNGPGPVPTGGGTVRTVAKSASNTGDYAAQYSTIQAAVNVAQEGDIIEILDEAEYAEQVTIDGREEHPWGTPVKGGKNWITIRYRPPSASAAARPSIKHQDITNRSPATPGEAKTQGDGPRTSGNFETNGALRIIRAEGITIEGIIVDGGGAAPFFNTGVWCGDDGKCYGLLHGNAAIAVAVSGNVQIRDCELHNAYFGIAVKDRNTGGVFGSPNPADNDNTIPLSGFGKNGYHLFEYNKIHNNSIGVYFESSWDRGSTVRYNLIYSNYHQTTATATTSEDKDDAKPAGGISFKDNYLSPVAIYNNTFHDNAGNLRGGWQVGYQHLIFNNIFGRTRTNNTNFDIHGMFPNRMKYNVFGGATQIQLWNQQTSEWCTEYRGRTYVEQVQFQPDLGTLAKVGDTVELCHTYNPPRETRRVEVIKPGTVFGASTQQAGTSFAAGSNNRWLEMAGTSSTLGNLPSLFKSVTATSADFLVPNWDSSAVSRYIRNGGWPDGVTNEDGTVADIGAIPFSGKRPGDGVAQKLRARVSPFSVVTVSGTSAVASLAVNQEIGNTGALTIKYIRWVVPIPNNKDKYGNNGVVVPSGAVRVVTGADGRAVDAGNSKITFTVAELGNTDSTGFFEVVLKGANGVTTDVGFLPYRKLDYLLRVEVLNGTTVVANPEVRAGDPVTLRVSAWKRGSGGAADTRYTTSAGSIPLKVDYNLTLPAAKMWRDANQAAALQYEPNLSNGTQYEQTYTVYFTKAGNEIVSAAGLWEQGQGANALRIPFLGDLQIKVKPGEADKVVFQNPMPKSQTTGATPPVTPPTIVGTYPVEVEVQDRYGNPVDTRLPVTMECLMPEIGCVETPTATTDAATGRANFTATIVRGVTGNIFDLAASASLGAKALTPDTGSLRVGRAANRLAVFYYQSTPPKHGSDYGDDWDAVEEIDALVGSRKQVWVKVAAGDTINTSSTAAFLCVTPSDPNIRFSAAEAGAAVAGPYLTAVSGGVATFWITADAAVDMASLTASVKTSADCAGAKDNSVTDGMRGSITFKPPVGGVGTAFVKGDGYGRPNYVEITFTGEGGAGGFNTTPETWRKPDSVTLTWPGVCAEAVVAKGTAITYDADGVTVGVTFNPAAFPEGYTAPPSAAQVQIYGAINESEPVRIPSALIDSIGPLIAAARPEPLCGAGALTPPIFSENTSPGVTPYVLRLQLTETLSDQQSLVGASIWISSDAEGTGETGLTVTGVERDGVLYVLTLATTSLLTDGYWIRLNPNISAITDASGVRVHPDNRRVRIMQSEVAPSINKAWYTTADATGLLDYIYITFDKPLTAADIPAWFNGTRFGFSWAGEGVLNVGAGNIGGISVDTRPNTIRISVADALTEAERNKMAGGIIITSANIGITLKYGPGHGKGWDTTMTATAVDEARPVLVSAVLQKGSVNDKDEFDPDTLILTYSEPTEYKGIGNPVSIKGSTSATGTPVLVTELPNKVPSGTGTGAHYEVWYLVVKMETSAGIPPKAGDLVHIYEEAGVADGVTPPNVQDKPDNRWVPLEIRLGKPLWRTKVKGNPFRDRERVVIETTPGPDMVVSAQIKLYDNMGKLVLEEGPIYNDPSVTGKNALEWEWRGRNKNGRTVGTGTYVFKAVYQVVGSAEIPPQSVTRSLGFVRGKQ